MPGGTVGGGQEVQEELVRRYRRRRWPGGTGICRGGQEEQEEMTRMYRRRRPANLIGLGLELQEK